MTGPNPALDHKPLSTIALIGFLAALIGFGLFAASVIGYRSGTWFVAEVMSLAEWAVYVSGVGCLLSLAGLVISRPGGGRRGLIVSLLGLVLSAPLLGMTARFDYTARAYPPINDITTDREDPPVFWDMPNPIDYPGGATAELQQTAYPDLAPMTLATSPEKTYALALDIVKDRRWEIVAEVPDEGRIEAVASSLIFGFKDEIVIRIQEDGDGSLVDIRSRSRVGRIDRGVNAKRIRAFLADLKQKTEE
ncbi:DUF1499 domain-containing protein [uncultured Roseibium sp.]|uniref:DUF1499 domain-containing protein n=1 Tax=uncultured Roseibium sp. TaxID=1936171 RepID=UPI003217285B